MGVIFTLQQLLENRIPSIDDYILADKLCRDEFKDLHEKGYIYGVLFYGSSVRKNEFRIGSDIDFIMVVNSLNPKFVDKLQKLTEKISNLNVPLEYNSVTKEQVKQNLHGYELCFINELKNTISNESVIGNNPLEIINSAFQDSDDIVSDFIKRYTGNLRRFGRDAFAPKYGEDYCRFLTRLINYTLFLPKEMCFIKYHNVPTNGIRPLSKEELVELYVNEFKEINPEPLEEILSGWKRYRTFFEEKLHDPQKYTTILDDITNCYKAVEEFTRKNMNFALKLS